MLAYKSRGDMYYGGTVVVSIKHSVLLDDENLVRAEFVVIPSISFQEICR